MVICNKFLRLVSWPTVLLLYGPSASGKTTLALEFLKQFCNIRSCLYVTYEPINVERMTSMNIKMENINVYRVYNVYDFLDIVIKKKLYLYEIIVIDPVNILTEIDEIQSRIVSLLLATLYDISEKFNTGVIEIARVRSVDGDIEPSWGKLLTPFVKSIAKLGIVASQLRSIEIKAPSKGEFTVEIGDRGLKWLKC